MWYTVLVSDNDSIFINRTTINPNYLMQTITQNQFVEMLLTRKGANIIGLVTETEPKARKTGNPFKEIKKLVHRTVVTGAKYKEAIIKQGAKSFDADPLPYGKFLIENKIILHEGELQLRTVYRNAPKPIKVQFLADGEEVSKEVVDKYLTKSSPSAKQERVGVTGKKQVKVRNYKLSNIKEIRMNGKRYILAS